jgi:hypothetical protein
MSTTKRSKFSWRVCRKQVRIFQPQNAQFPDYFLTHSFHDHNLPVSPQPTSSTGGTLFFNMAKSLPSASNAAESPDNEETARLPKNAEDRKAAAALNSLNANEISQDETAGTSSKQPSAADQEAVGKAMSRLEIASGTGGRKDAEKKSDKKAAEAEVKKKVKIASEDVNLLVSAYDAPLRVFRILLHAGTE